MNKLTKYGSLLLAFALIFIPIMTNAANIEDNMDKDLINEEVEEMEEYLTYEGHIVNVDKNDGGISILVKAKEDKKDTLDEIVFHLSEDVLLLSDKTMEEIETSHLKEDMKVLVFYRANTPMTLSIPPQATPDGLVVLENKDLHFTKIAKFNDELVSKDNELKLNIQKDTPMVDTKGEKLVEEDLKDENLLVFYDMTTKSIPAQTNPHKVILLDEVDIEEELTVLDKILIDTDEADDKQTKSLENEMYRNEDKLVMVPLREVGIALGYEVTWDGEKRAAQLTKGAQWTEVVIGEGTEGEDNYNFAKMIVKLGTSPVLKDSKLYVPVNFIDEVLQRELALEDGMLQIK